MDEQDLAATQESAEVQAPLARRLVAEFVGALGFIAIGTGAATVISVRPLARIQQLSDLQGFEDPTLRRIYRELFTSTDVLAIALAFGLGLAAMIYAFGGVSGGHFNPAVTFGLALARRFSWAEVPGYWIAQCLGGIAAAFVVAGIYGEAGVQDGTLLGATVVAVDVSFFQGVLAEAFITFILVTAVMAIAVDPRAPKGWSGLVIGLALAGGILVTGQATGGSANFARSLGPFVASLPYDFGSIPWADLYTFALGPLIGASAAALVYEAVTGLEPVAPAPRPGAATATSAQPVEPEPPPVVATPAPVEPEPGPVESPWRPLSSEPSEPGPLSAPEPEIEPEPEPRPGGASGVEEWAPPAEEERPSESTDTSPWRITEREAEAPEKEGPDEEDELRRDDDRPLP